jgi:hypothetical protein
MHDGGVRSGRRHPWGWWHQLRVSEIHGEAADCHERAAGFWQERGDLVRAGSERGKAAVQRVAAESQREREELAGRGS